MITDFRPVLDFQTPCNIYFSGKFYKKRLNWNQLQPVNCEQHSLSTKRSSPESAAFWEQRCRAENFLSTSRPRPTKVVTKIKNASQVFSDGLDPAYEKTLLIKGNTISDKHDELLRGPCPAGVISDKIDWALRGGAAAPPGVA